jgi:hypothetical protein
MDNFENRYGSHIFRLIDRRVSMKEFEFDQTLLMPTAKGYRALVEEAEIEIKPRIMNYLSRNLSEGAIENLSFFAMAVAVFARSISEPPIEIDVGKVLIKTVAFCNLRCTHRKGNGEGCQIAMNKGQHHLPKCIKLPRDIGPSWRRLKRYIATGGAICGPQAIGVQEAMGVEANLASDFAPATSC